MNQRWHTQAGSLIDWSTFWPDMIVALFTGLVIGAVLLGTERWLQWRAERDAILKAQISAVVTFTEPLADPFDYQPNTLLPPGEFVKRVRRELSRIPTEPAPKTSAVGYQALRLIVQAWQSAELAAERLNAAIAQRDVWLESAEEFQQTGGFGASIRDFVLETQHLEAIPWRALQEDWGLDDLSEDQELVRIVQEYRDRRAWLDASRESFVVTVTTFEAVSYTAVSQAAFDLRHSWWKRRAWRSRRRRLIEDSANEATDAGLAVFNQVRVSRAGAAEG